jgi:Family of unknown function (DUF6152)
MRRTTLFLIVFFSAQIARAHHGGGSFDLSQTIHLSGKLTKVDLINPHSWLYFEATDKSGKVTRYRCEMRSVHVLRRSGWTQELFPIGQQIKVDASPDRADPNSCYLQTIVFENGSRMDRYGQYVKGQSGIQEVRGPLVTPSTKREPRRPTGEPNIAGDWAPEQRVMADPRGVGGGLVRLSTLNQPTPERGAGGGGARRGGGQPAGPRLYGGTELTELGQKEATAFKREDNPRFRCETTSIIFDWDFDGPVNRITQSKDTIVLQYGQFGLKRTIYMNLKQHPANIKPSRPGHSIGRWENDVLVVDTIGFAPGVLSGPVRHSDKLHVTEHFSLEPKTMTLTRSYEAEDPVYLKGKYTGSDTVNVADAPYSPGRCQELGFIDYSKEVQRGK